VVGPLSFCEVRDVSLKNVGLALIRYRAFLAKENKGTVENF